MGNLDFHNFLFLYCQELNLADTNVNNASLYEFVPYKFRHFSFICNTDRRRLVDSDLLTDGADRWELTGKGRTTARQLQDESVIEFVRIQYEHLLELGIESDRRRGLKTQANLNELLKEYEQYNLPDQLIHLEKISD